MDLKKFVDRIDKTLETLERERQSIKYSIKSDDDIILMSSLINTIRWKFDAININEIALEELSSISKTIHSYLEGTIENELFDPERYLKDKRDRFLKRSIQLYHTSTNAIENIINVYTREAYVKLYTFLNDYLTSGDIHMLI